MPNEIYIGDAQINLKKLDVKINNKTVNINPQEKKILEKMLEVPGKVFSRNDIGKIINISSISSDAVSINRGDYCIAKAGLRMVTKLFAARLADAGINVYEVRPGIIASDMTEPVKNKYDKMINEGLTPIRRWGQPSDVGKAVVALAQDYFPFTTGDVFNVDGGFTVRRI